MRVFVTGATGFIGSATVDELLSRGHTVLGLARNDASAEALKAKGVEAHRGDLTDLDSLVAGAKASDGIIHTAFVHDFSQFMANIETDRRAVAAMAAELEGSSRPMVIASGTMMISGLNKLGVETDAPPDPNGPRVAAETIVLNAPGVRGSVVRLSPTVHGAGDHGFVPALVEAAKRDGFVGLVGDGANRWPAVHRLDAARVFVLGLEKAPAGSRLHAVAEEGIPMRRIVETIGEGLGVPVRNLNADEAGAHLGFLTMFVGTDNPISSAITQSMLGWTPKEIDLLADMKANYFG